MLNTGEVGGRLDLHWQSTSFLVVLKDNPMLLLVLTATAGMDWRSTGVCTITVISILQLGRPLLREPGVCLESPDVKEVPFQPETHCYLSAVLKLPVEKPRDTWEEDVVECWFQHASLPHSIPYSERPWIMSTYGHPNHHSIMELVKHVDRFDWGAP